MTKFFFAFFVLASLAGCDEFERYEQQARECEAKGGVLKSATGRGYVCLQVIK